MGDQRSEGEKREAGESCGVGDPPYCWAKASRASNGLPRAKKLGSSELTTRDNIRIAPERRGCFFLRGSVSPSASMASQRWRHLETVRMSLNELMIY